MCLVKNEIYREIIFKNSLTKISEIMTMGQKRPLRLQVAQEERAGRPHPTRLQGIVIMKAFVSPSSADKKD